MGVSVREIECKSALVKSGIPGVDFALNPYTGCEHACVYCYASFMSKFSPHPEPWGQYVDVKMNIANALVRDLEKLGRSCSMRRLPMEIPFDRGYGLSSCEDVQILYVTMSSVTDPYQPVEREYRLSRGCLEILAGRAGSKPSGIHLSLLTKSDLVLRDLEVLQELDLTVGLTITHPRDEVSLRFEPGAPPSSRRFAALSALARAGLDTRAFMAPILPVYSDSREAIRELFSKLADCGVKKVCIDRFNPYRGSVLGFCRASGLRVRDVEDHLDSRTSNARLRDLIIEESARVGIPVEIFFE